MSAHYLCHLHRINTMCSGCPSTLVLYWRGFGRLLLHVQFGAFSHGCNEESCYEDEASHRGYCDVQRKLGKEDMQAMAERLSRVETKEKKEEKAHPMQLKYEYDAKSRKYTEKYIRAKKASHPCSLPAVNVHLKQKFYAMPKLKLLQQGR